MDNYFTKLNSINVSEHLEKKGQFAYLSWPYAVAQLRQADPTATWNVVRVDGLPFLKTDCGYFVEVEVTVEGVRLSQIHPVLDAKNRPIEMPNAFDINTSIQRCLVKAIALHGLGLYSRGFTKAKSSQSTKKYQDQRQAVAPDNSTPNVLHKWRRCIRFDGFLNRWQCMSNSNMF